MSERSGPSARDGAALLAEAGWSALEDLVVMALCHDLNGRLASLRAASDLVQMGEAVPEGLDREIDRLERLTGLLALLVGELDAPPVPVFFDTLLQRALELHGVLTQGGDAGLVERLGTDPSPPVLVGEGRCLRSLLLLVHHACRVRPEGAPVLCVETDPSGVRVSFAHASEEAEPTTAWLSSLDALVSLDGGSVRLEGGRCSLWLPALVASEALAPRLDA